MEVHNKNVRSVQVLAATAMVLALNHNAAAMTDWTFSGSDAGGTASAEMSFNLSGTDLTISLDNTSPTLTDNGSTWNSPGITFFGFDATTSSGVAIDSWSLTAYDLNGVLQVIGSNDTNACAGIGGCIWDLALDAQRSGVQLEYMATNGNGVNAALYNPASLSNGGSYGGTTPYFTAATLSMSLNDGSWSSIDSAFVRMQNVGTRGAGSVKLYGFGDGPGPDGQAPEPTSLALLGLGLGVTAWRRRRSTT